MSEQMEVRIDGQTILANVEFIQEGLLEMAETPEGRKLLGMREDQTLLEHDAEEIAARIWKGATEVLDRRKPTTGSRYVHPDGLEAALWTPE